MKEGRTIQELAAEVQRQYESKKDYIADSRSVKMEDDGKTITVIDKPFEEKDSDFKRLMSQPVKAPFFSGEATHHAHTQIASRLGIPQKYYDRMQAEAPDLLAANVNRWFNQNPEKRMIRTLDGRARAILSDRYRPLDNYDLCHAWLPQITQMQLKIVSCEITESHLYFKALNEKLNLEINPRDHSRNPNRDIVQAGICISNSEIGCGSLKVEPLVYRLVCRNGLIVQDVAMRKYHVGRNSGELDGAREFYRDETRRADDKAFWLKVRDTVSATFDDKKFREIVERWKATTEREITSDPVKVVEVAANQYQLAEKEQGDVLRHLISGGDLSQFGLANAITRMSQDVESYDRATDLERLGGAVMELPQTDWQRLNKEAA